MDSAWEQRPSVWRVLRECVAGVRLWELGTTGDADRIVERVITTYPSALARAVEDQGDLT
jgi:hypothetical protein